jgi:hypothetical protein
MSDKSAGRLRATMELRRSIVPTEKAVPVALKALRRRRRKLSAGNKYEAARVSARLGGGTGPPCPGTLRCAIGRLTAAEDEPAYESTTHTAMEVSVELVPQLANSLPSAAPDKLFFTGILAAFFGFCCRPSIFTRRARQLGGRLTASPDLARARR